MPGATWLLPTNCAPSAWPEVHWLAQHPVTECCSAGGVSRAVLASGGIESAAAEQRQLTQGMPFSAPTAPPCGPVVGMTGDDEGLGVVVAAALMVGTVVVSAPISTST